MSENSLKIILDCIKKGSQNTETTVQNYLRTFAPSVKLHRGDERKILDKSSSSSVKEEEKLRLTCLRILYAYNDAFDKMAVDCLDGVVSDVLQCVQACRSCKEPYSRDPAILVKLLYHFISKFSQKDLVTQTLELSSILCDEITATILLKPEALDEVEIVANSGYKTLWGTALRFSESIDKENVSAEQLSSKKTGENRIESKRKDKETKHKGIEDCELKMAALDIDRSIEGTRDIMGKDRSMLLQIMGLRLCLRTKIESSTFSRRYCGMLAGKNSVSSDVNKQLYSLLEEFVNFLEQSSEDRVLYGVSCVECLVGYCGFVHVVVGRENVEEKWLNDMQGLMDRFQTKFERRTGSKIEQIRSRLIVLAINIVRFSVGLKSRGELEGEDMEKVKKLLAEMKHYSGLLLAEVTNSTKPTTTSKSSAKTTSTSNTTSSNDTTVTEAYQSATITISAIFEASSLMVKCLFWVVENTKISQDTARRFMTSHTELKIALCYCDVSSQMWSLLEAGRNNAPANQIDLCEAGRINAPANDFERCYVKVGHCMMEAVELKLNIVTSVHKEMIASGGGTNSKNLIEMCIKTITEYRRLAEIIYNNSLIHSSSHLENLRQLSHSMGVQYYESTQYDSAIFLLELHLELLQASFSNSLKTNVKSKAVYRAAALLAECYRSNDCLGKAMETIAMATHAVTLDDLPGLVKTWLRIMMKVEQMEKPRDGKSLVSAGEKKGKDADIPEIMTLATAMLKIGSEIKPLFTIKEVLRVEMDIIKSNRVPVGRYRELVMQELMSESSRQQQQHQHYDNDDNNILERYRLTLENIQLLYSSGKQQCSDGMTLLESCNKQIGELSGMTTVTSSQYKDLLACFHVLSYILQDPNPSCLEKILHPASRSKPKPTRINDDDDDDDDEDDDDDLAELRRGEWDQGGLKQLHLALGLWEGIFGGEGGVNRGVSELVDVRATLNYMAAMLTAYRLSKSPHTYRSASLLYRLTLEAPDCSVFRLLSCRCLIESLVNLGDTVTPQLLVQQCDAWLEKGAGEQSIYTSPLIKYYIEYLTAKGTCLLAEKNLKQAWFVANKIKSLISSHIKPRSVDQYIVCVPVNIFLAKLERASNIAAHSNPVLNPFPVGIGDVDRLRCGNGESIQTELELIAGAGRGIVAVLKYLAGDQNTAEGRGMESQMDWWHILYAYLEVMQTAGLTYLRAGEGRESKIYLQQGLRFANAFSLTKWHIDFSLSLTQLYIDSGNLVDAHISLTSAHRILTLGSEGTFTRPAPFKAPPSETNDESQTEFTVTDRYMRLNLQPVETKDLGSSPPLGKSKRGKIPTGITVPEFWNHELGCDCERCEDLYAIKQLMRYFVVQSQVALNEELYTESGAITKSLKSFVVKLSPHVRAVVSKVVEVINRDVFESQEILGKGIGINTGKDQNMAKACKDKDIAKTGKDKDTVRTGKDIAAPTKDGKTSKKSEAKEKKETVKKTDKTKVLEAEKIFNGMESNIWAGFGLILANIHLVNCQIELAMGNMKSLKMLIQDEVVGLLKECNSGLTLLDYPVSLHCDLVASFAYLYALANVVWSFSNGAGFGSSIDEICAGIGRIKMIDRSEEMNETVVCGKIMTSSELDTTEEITESNNITTTTKPTKSIRGKKTASIVEDSIVEAPPPAIIGAPARRSRARGAAACRANTQPSRNDKINTSAEIPRMACVVESGVVNLAGGGVVNTGGGGVGGMVFGRGRGVQGRKVKEVLEEVGQGGGQIMEQGHPCSIADAYELIRRNPPAILYRNLCHLLALESHKAKDEWSVAYYLSLSHGIAFRHCCVVSSGRKIGKLDSNASQGLSSRLSKFRDEMIFSDSIDSFKTHVNTLPQELVVCELTVVQMSAVGGVRSSNHARPLLYMTRLQKNHQPITVRLAQYTTLQGQKLHQDFESIMRENMNSLIIKEKAQWWKTREDINSNLQELLQDIEDDWLGCWKGLLLPPLRNEADQKYLSEAAGKFITTNNLQTSSQALVECLLTVAHTCTDRQLIQGLQLLQSCASIGCSSDSSLKQSMQLLESLRISSKQLSGVLSIATRGDLSLVLDRTIQHLPMENIPVLIDRRVTRCQSMSFLSAQLRLLLSDHASLLHTGVEPRNVFYVINPDQNLPNTQATFEELFNRYRWDGVSGCSPTSDQMSQALTKRDLLVYAGHGTGSKYLGGECIQQLHSRAAAVLMGCSSGKLLTAGSLEATGQVLSYLMSGSSCVVANLWDVTDRDIDRYMKALLAGWLMSSTNQETDTKGKPVIGQSSTNQETESKGKPVLNQTSTNQETDTKGKPVIGQASKRDSLITNYSVSSRLVCRFRYLIGAAPVVYGVPVTRKNTQGAASGKRK